LVCGGLFMASVKEVRPDVNPDLFKLAETENIDHVVLQSTGKTIDLKFENNHWKVNNTWEADTRMIKVLFATLKQVEPRRPVAASLRDSVKSLLEQKGIRVSLSGGGVSKSFLSGGNTLKTETWFLKDGDSQPYSMIIPGYRVYVAGILELDESGWRNKRIFDFNWQNFKSLTSGYPKDPKQGFEIGRKDRSLGIKDMPEADTTKLNNYVDAVSLLFATRFVPAGQSKTDSLVKVAPAVKIEITDIANRSYVLELFAPGKKDSEIYGRLGDGQMVALDKSSVAEIVRRREYFLPVKSR
jgi:Domain of unknown function (DUF4340)